VAPSDAEVAHVLDTIRRRVQRLLRHRGLEPRNEGTGPDDPLAEASLALAGLMGASVQGRVALGPRAGARVRRLGDGPTAATGARGPRQAHVEGFNLHANVWVGAHDRARLEQLCRYLLRPPLADDRLRLLGDGRVRVQPKRAWSDGTTHLLFEPVEFLEKLAALTPRPAINLILYHGVLAPHSRWRPEDGVVYDSYSAYSRGVDGLWGMYQWLERAPRGRNDTGLLWRRHDEYGQKPIALISRKG
jgi:hypothetical protein